MSKALAFLSYGVNAGVMLVVALILAKSLKASEYSHYSFAVATSQTLSVCLFEWLRLSATRYYPGPDPAGTKTLREAFLGGQHVLSFCAIAFSIVVGLIVGDISSLLVTAYAVLQGFVDLQFTMLRFDAQLRLFSKLQTFRGIIALILVVSAALFFRNANAALIGGMLANVLTIASLEFTRPGFVLAAPSFSHIATLREMAKYGISAAAAGGLYQFGPFLLRCAAFRGASDVSYAAFSLVADLMQRPYNVVLNALNGVFFPDAVREHDQSPRSDRLALRLLYAIQVWCLLMIFGCAMAFRNELMPLLVKSELLPSVLAVFPFLSAFFLMHSMVQTTSALVLHLNRAGLQLILQAAIELGSIAALAAVWTNFIAVGIVPVACGGMLGALIGFLSTIPTWRTVPCRLPWASWTAALVTTLLLVLIGQTEADNRIMGLILKASIIGPVIAIGGLVGFAMPFGFVERVTWRHWRVVRPSSTPL